MTGTRTVQLLGDRAVLVGTTDVRAAHALAAELRRQIGTGSAPGGIEELVVGFANLVVILSTDSDLTDQPEVVRWLAGTAAAMSTSPPPEEVGTTSWP